jgi:hypothetical protein
MQDRESQSEANPGRVERGLDAAATQGPENSENPELRGGPVLEREREDGGQITPREAFDGPGQAGRENILNGSRSGGMENRPGDRSDAMPGTSAGMRAAPREDPASGGGLS